MIIAIDGREAFSNTRTGKGLWTFYCIKELLKYNHKLIVFVKNSNLNNYLQEILKRFTTHCEVVTIKKRGVFWHIALARYLKERRDIDVYISTTSYIVPLLAGHHRPTVTVVHDTIAFHPSLHDLKATLIERSTLNYALQQSASICALSESTKHDLLHMYPGIESSKIVTVFAGPTMESPHTTGLKDGSILSIGTLCPRKNQERLLLAYRSLSREFQNCHPLLLIGKRGWNDRSILRLVQSIPSVEWRGYASDEECHAAMCRASIFAFPSLYEGFGIPLLDAFSCGTPVLTSACGSLREVSGDAALQVDPLSVPSIAEGLSALADNPIDQEKLIQRGKVQMEKYTWKMTVDHILQAVDCALGSWSRHR